MSGEIVCSFAALDVLGEALQINVRRFPFAIPHHRATREDRLRLVEAVHQDLVARGLVRDGEFVPELVEALHVFARGHVVIALVGTAGEAQPAALAVADDRTGVVAEQRGEAVVFRLCQPDAIVPGLVRLLPQMRSGPGAFAPEPPAPPKEPGDPGRPPIAPNPGFTGQGNTPPPRVGNDTTNTSWTAPQTTGNNSTNTSGLNSNLGGNGLPLGNQGGNNQLGGNTNLNLGGPLPGPNSGSRSTQGGPGGRAGGGPAGRGGISGTGGTGGGRLPGGSVGLGNPNAAKGFGPGGSAGVMPGGESAAGRGGTAAGGAAGRGSAAGGAMGGMGASAAKGQGDEDIERTSPSYLLEPDPDEIFGNDTLVAPPVLGE